MIKMMATWWVLMLFLVLAVLRQKGIKIYILFFVEIETYAYLYSCFYSSWD